MNELLKHVAGLSPTEFLDYVRAVYMAGAYSYDPTSGEDIKLPTDGDLLGLTIDHFGGAAAVFGTCDNGRCIKAAANPEEIANALRDLEHGGRLAITKGYGGYDLSEDLSNMFAEVLREKINSTMIQRNGTPA